MCNDNGKPEICCLICAISIYIYIYICILKGPNLFSFLSRQCVPRRLFLYFGVVLLSAVVLLSGQNKLKQDIVDVLAPK